MLLKYFQSFSGIDSLIDVPTDFAPALVAFLRSAAVMLHPKILPDEIRLDKAAPQASTFRN
jgi:hypothetical protein